MKQSFFDRALTRTRIRSANVKPVESLLGYLVGPFCAMLANGIFTTYLNRYFRNVLFAEELASGSALAGTVEGFLTIFPILSAVLIVIGNLVAGQLVERTRTKAGKARPWILLSAVLLAVSSVLIFIQPSNDPTFKMAWLVIAYNLYYAVAFPLYNTANSTLTPLSTRNSKQRSVLASFVNMSLLGAVGAGSMVFPFLLSILIKPEMSFGTQKTFWMILFIIVAVITFLGTVMQYYFTRERVTEERRRQSRVSARASRQRLPSGTGISGSSSSFTFCISSAAASRIPPSTSMQRSLRRHLFRPIRLQAYWGSSARCPWRSRCSLWRRCAISSASARCASSE